jgi:hypothetical protein
MINLQKHNPYEEMGYPTRRAYLKGLADDFGVDIEIVLSLASALGPNEDFDGLVTELEDLL